MKNIIIVFLIFALLGCGEDRVIVINNSDKILELQQRMLLNEQLDLAQSLLIQANADAIAAEREERISADDFLYNLIIAEQAARANGDAVLAAELTQAIADQTAINNVVNNYIINILDQLANLSTNLVSLQSQVNNNISDIASLIINVNNLSTAVTNLSSVVGGLSNSISNLTAQVNNLQNDVAAHGVYVFKCNAVGSRERIMRINGKFYAIMNYVVTSPVQIITGSSPISIPNPGICQKNVGIGDDRALADSDNTCKPNWSLLPGTGTPANIVIPAYTMATINTITSVKIALEQLLDGTYVTTDGGPACTFTISGGGTISSNLILAH